MAQGADRLGRLECPLAGRGADRTAHSRRHSRACAARPQGEFDLAARCPRRARGRPKGAARNQKHGRREYRGQRRDPKQASGGARPRSTPPGGIIPLRWATSFRNGGRHHSVTAATSSRYDGRLGQGISTLPPGSIYTASVAQDGTVGMYRVEVSVSAGSGKLRTAGGVSGVTKESISRAFSYMLAKKGELSIAHELDVSDLHVEVIDLMNNHIEGEIGLGFLIAAFSALKKAPPVAAMLVLGDVSVQGNIKGLRSLVEPLQIAMDNGAKKALIPIENKRNFLEVSGDIVEHVDPIFFGDPKSAAFKALGLN